MSQAKPESLAASAPISWACAPRHQAFEAWLAEAAPRHGLQPHTLSPASADASFRRYFRIASSQGSFVIMDAPPEHENCQPFVAVAHLLEGGGVAVPHIFEWDEAQGFMLLSDLGPHTMLSTLVPNESQAEANRARYAAATQALLGMQAIQAANQLPPYDDALLQRELNLLPDWYLTQLRGLALDAAQRTTLDKAFALIKAQVLAQPTVLVHRDFHSRNLMADPQNPQARMGVIDFQDAVWGPITYDLVSLLRDAYIMWDEDVQLDHAVRYWQQARQAGLPVAADFGEFWRDFEWMGLQRHLKVLGIFARLALRDGKRQYLDDIPRVWTYAHRVASRYQGLGPLAKLLEAAEAANGGPQTQVAYTF